MRPRAPIRVLVADDTPAMRNALILLIDNDPALELAAAVGTAVDAIAAAERVRPDVALVDVRMPGGGIRAARGIGRCAPATRILALSAADDRPTVLKMLEAGAIGYLVKGAAPDEIAAAVTRAAEGEASLSEEVSGKITKPPAGTRRPAGEEQQEGEARIRAIIEDAALTIVFQPIRRLDGPTVGAEALSRFRGPPERGPEHWFAEAGEAGLRLDLELAAIRLALDDLPRLPDDGFMSLNASPETLCAPDLVSLLTGAAPERVVLELSERAPIEDDDALDRALAGFGAHGIRIAIDDTGSGSAGLRHLLRLAPDFIKLDRTLVDGIDRDRSQQAVAAGLVSFAERIDAAVVAEGIERDEEVELLRSLGVRYGQGFLLARPQPLPLGIATA
jgi:EAL domain-containing protein (putative c-di-GMP-specific phosphodiesterase class I)/DNA-binding NarL/FixJ family response regulator